MKTLEDKILTRVRRIYFLHRVFAPTALKAYGLAMCALMLLSIVSVVSVIDNMPAITAPGALGAFLMRALLHTELVVQILLVGFIFAVVMLVRDLVRGVGKQRSFHEVMLTSS